MQDQREGRIVTRWLGAAGAAAVVVGLSVASWWLGGLTSAPAAQAQIVPPPESAGITVVGDGLVRGRPDAVTIRLGVQVTASTPAEALSQVRQATDRVLGQLRAAGAQDANIQTSGLNVFPIITPAREPGGQETVTGYRGTTTITVDGQAIDRAGPLLDAAIQGGASSVQGVSFGFRDDGQQRRDALAAAISEARAEAEAAATAAGVRLGAIRSIQELQADGPIPLHAQQGGLGGGAGIAPGELSVVARVQVTFDLVR
ncbi:MAG TPA: SIMPL domain-containing protein [Chloroflexota bacterium]|jgi:uncharacterized protein YggE|nr:SIMPL domain-containing protein [Chloroflexota bacterium]